VSGGTELPVRVTRITPVAERVKRFRFERLDGQPMPYFSGGAHVIVSMDDDGHIRRNAYSLMSPPHDCSAYEVSVLHVENSRGGSTFLHEFQHNKFNVASDSVDVLFNAFHPLYPSPIRPDPHCRASFYMVLAVTTLAADRDRWAEPG